MIRFQRYYAGYRRAGIGRVDALRFAWMVATAGVGRMALRVAPRR